MSTTKLAEAARAVIDRWDSPAWKDAPHTGEYIHALRQALASYEAAQAEAKPAPAVEFDHSIGEGRYTTHRAAFWWHVRIGDSPENVGKFRTQSEADDMALKLLTAFRDGAFMQYQAAPAAPAPAGFVLVPVEPTPEMLKRFDGFEFRAPFDPKHAALREGLWRSILNAAPAAPAPATELSDDELDALIPQWRHTTAAANEVCWQRRDVRQAMRAAIAAAPAAPAPRNTDTQEHLSTMIGMVLGARQRGKMEYLDGSVMHKDVEAAIEHLKDWPYPEAAPAAPAPSDVRSGWSTPTTYAHRFAHAVSLLCGKWPDASMVDSWLDKSSDALQDFAADHGPEWAQGIVLLDAAAVMADTPTEGVEHGERAPAAPAPPTDEQILRLVETHVGGPCPSYPLDGSDWINFARAAIAASNGAAPAAPAPAWQLIDTAPKNCVDVLLHIPGRQPVVAAFYRGGWAPMDLGGNHLRQTPTHWMPLPEAPAIAASKGEQA